MTVIDDVNDEIQELRQELDCANDEIKRLNNVNSRLSKDLQKYIGRFIQIKQEMLRRDVTTPRYKESAIDRAFMNDTRSIHNLHGQPATRSFSYTASEAPNGSIVITRISRSIEDPDDCHRSQYISRPGTQSHRMIQIQNGSLMNPPLSFTHPKVSDPYSMKHVIDQIQYEDSQLHQSINQENSDEQE